MATVSRPPGITLTCGCRYSSTGASLCGVAQTLRERYDRAYWDHISFPHKWEARRRKEWAEREIEDHKRKGGLYGPGHIPGAPPAAESDSDDGTEDHRALHPNAGGF